MESSLQSNLDNAYGIYIYIYMNREVVSSSLFGDSLICMPFTLLCKTMHVFGYLQQGLIYSETDLSFLRDDGERLLRQSAERT